MIFRTITTDLDGAINKIGIFNKSFANLKNVISLKTSNGKINNGVRGLFNSISFGITEKDISNIKEYNRLVGEDGVSSQTAWYQTMMSSSKAAQSLFDNEKNLIMTENGAIVSTEALTVAQNTMSLSTKAAAVGMKTLATAGNMLLMWGISEAVSWAAKGIDNLIHYEEKQKEIFENATKATEEHAKAIHDLKSEMSDTSTKASDLASEYAKLVQGVNSFTNENESLSTDRYEKFLDVNNQLAELFPSLTRNYDENGNAILGLSGDVDTVTASIQRLVEQQTNLAKADMREHLEDYVNGTNDKEGIFDSLKGYKKNVNETQNELNNLQDVYNSIINHKGKRTYIGNDYNTFLDDVKNKLGQEAYDALHSVTDKKYQDKGDTWYSIDFSRLELDEVTKGKIIKSYNTFFNDLQTTLSIRQSELESKNKEMSNQMMIWVEDLDFYKNSNNESFKKAIKSMVGSIQWSDLEVENGDIDEAKQIIQSLIITPLTNACDNPDTKLSVTNALCSVFTINFSDLPYEEAKQQVENFLNIILNALNIGLPDDKKKSIEDLYNAFNLENYRDTPDKMKSSLDSITGDNQEDFKKLTDYTKNFNQSQAEAWLTVTEGAKNADEAIRRFEENQKPAVSSSKLPFDKAWNQLKNNTGAFKDNDDTKDTANNLLELAEAGKLTVKAFEKTKGSDDFLTQTKLSAEEATKQITELVDSSKHLSELKKGIGAIGSAYNEKKDSKENTVNPDTLSSMYDTLGIDSWTKKDKKVWEEYKNAATDASAPVKKLKKYQDELATSYLNSNNFLSNLDGSTEEHYKTLLKDMGIKNAEKIVDEQLIANSQVQKYESEALSAATEDLGNKTWNTSNAFLKQARMTDLAKAQLVDLISQEKIFAEDSNLSPDEKIKKLNKLSKAYFETGFSVQLAGVMGSDSRFFGDGGADAFIEEQWQKHLKKVRKTLRTDIEVDPTVTNPKDKTKDTTKDKTQSTAKIFNWIETRISRLERRISKATSKAEDSYRSFEKRAKSYSRAIKLTTDEIKAQEKAADKYFKKADKSKLSDNLKKKVRNGTIDIQKIKDEKTQKQVEEYQENWEKYLAHKDEADNLRQKKKQYRRDKIELENTKLDESNESLESENNLISENIEHSKERGQFDLSGNYKQQIGNNQKQVGNIEEQNKNLEKLKKTVAEGSEAWNGYESRIQSNNESINSLKNSNAELAEAMYNLPIEERDSLLEEYDSKDELLNAKSENALSAGEKNQYSDEIIANIKSRQSVRQNAVEGTKDNVLSNIPAGGGNDVYDKIQSCISSGQPIGKDLISAVSGNPDLYYACKAYNEALLDKMLYDETAKADIQSQLSSQRDNIESSANEQLESISTDETKLQADISKSEAAGLSQSKAQYTEQIRLSKEREKALQNEHSQLENWLNDMMAAGEITEGDEQYEETQNKLKNMDAEIVNCIADQIQFGTEIKEMDLSRLEKLASLLDVAKNRLAGLASLAEAHGHNASDDLIAEQIETSITDAKNYKDMMQEYREQLLDPENLTEWGISKNLMENVITLVDKGNVNGAKDLLKDNGIDIENLAGFQEYMNGLASSTSSCYSAMVEGEKHYDSLYQNRIDKLSEYLDGLQKEKDLKDRTLALEKARFALEKAKNNLTKKVWNGSQWVYTADTEAVQSAQEAYDNTAFDELTHSIQDAIEVLEKLMKSDNLYDDNGNLIKNPDAGSLVKTADDNYVSLTSAQQNNIPQSAMPVPQLNIQNTAVPDFTLPAASGAGTVHVDKVDIILPNINDNSKAYDLAMSLRNELMSLRTYSQQYNWNQ